MKFKLSPLLIGTTVVSFGTSAPELIVSINAVLDGNSQIAVGNVIVQILRMWVLYWDNCFIKAANYYRW